MEFAGAKLGLTPYSHLSMEYPAQMRPWLQPWLYWCLAKAWLGLGVTNPFTWATSFRIFSSLIGWASVVAMVLCAPVWFASARWRRFFIPTVALIWVLPSFHARTSSENLGGSLFLIGLCLLVYFYSKRAVRPLWPALAAGAFFGLSFECRFQMAIAAAGAFAWFLFIARARVREIAGLLVGGVAIFALGRAIDYWGYGQWCLSPWNYFRFNLLESHGADLSIAPWWDYVRLIWTETWPPLGFALLVAAITSWVRRPRDAVTWAYLPFFAVHCLIGHKETRFLYPIAHAAPLILVFALEGLRWPRWLGLFVLSDDLLALGILCFIPAGRSVPFQHAVYRHAMQAPMELATMHLDPFSFLGFEMEFYRPPVDRFHLTVASSYAEVERELVARRELWFSYPDGLELPPEAGALRAQCERRYSTVPEWALRHFGRFVTGTPRVWSLFECRMPASTRPS